MSGRIGSRPLTALCLAAAISAAGLVASLSGASGATSSATMTKSFNFTGDEQLFTVPDGVTSVTVSAVGGKGAAGSPVGAPGGLGAVTNADLAVSPGQVLFVEVGGSGVSGGAFNGGGVGGGGEGNRGGGGGGATDVRTIARNSASGPIASANSRLVTAAGGGGGGGRDMSGTSFGGDGGSAGVQPLGNGTNGSGAFTLPGGGSGPSGTGGFAGTQGGGPPTGVGGTGDSTATGVTGGSGGGGGGGRAPGGGGGAAGADDTGGGGGGGGGGASGFATTATQSSIQGDTTAVPLLRITYKVAEGGANKSGLKFGKPKLNKKKGTALLPVTVPGSGKLSIGGKGLVHKRPGLARALGALAKKIPQAGTYKLKVKGKGKKKRKLFSTGKVKVKAVVTFKPTSGDPVKARKRIKLTKS